MSAEHAATGGRLPELAAFPWRKPTTDRSLRRRGWLWTAWTVSVATPFYGAGVLLVWLEPLAFPAALWSFAHGWAIPMLSARRGARSAVGTDDRGHADARADRVALGLLGDLLGHEERELASRTGLAMHRGKLGVWLIGERGALLVRRGGHRVDCWCVRVAEPEDLPRADRMAHLLLALREDEAGFATIANHGFSGARWRVRRRLPERCRPAIDAARAAARS